MTNFDNAKSIPVGIVGIGLMGSSILLSLLVSGHPVVAIAPIPGEKELGWQRIIELFEHCKKEGLLNKPVQHYLDRLIISDDYAQLNNCQLVMECVMEKLEIKQQVYQKIAAVVNSNTVVASNTSAIPITLLQQFWPFPENFLGIHWAEPAYATRFLEVTCGDLTNLKTAEWVMNLSKGWDKEPTLLKKDIRGFITNRLMYAVYREGLHLEETGAITLEDADKAFRYDVGSWITVMGLFRRMDFMGLSDFSIAFEALFERLSTQSCVPEKMREIVALNIKGVKDAKGLYNYTDEEARAWESSFSKFNNEIYQLAKKYSIRYSSIHNSEEFSI
ncbi:MAG: 3-hydroxyacyl-CoA dehydrogenase family protein [Pedobacter sp.]|uniref:3-hydroxyacyl-CoA dehydrogenase family protein n=1 Tax=Pedobacter sp. TaxID=1411316 RepID=UPI0035670BCD